MYMYTSLSVYNHVYHESASSLSTEDLFSALYYIENFHWSLADADRLSYTLVTFRAAVEYIRGKEVEKWLPKKKENSSQVSVKERV